MVVHILLDGGCIALLQHERQYTPSPFYVGMVYRKTGCRNVLIIVQPVIKGLTAVQLLCDCSYTAILRLPSAIRLTHLANLLGALLSRWQFCLAGTNLNDHEVPTE